MTIAPPDALGTAVSQARQDHPLSGTTLWPCLGTANPGLGTSWDLQHADF